MGCLTGLVGMSPNDCPCIDNDELVVDTNLYIDDLEIGVPLIFPQSSLDCGEGDLITLATRARLEAETTFLTELQNVVQLKNRISYKAFTDIIGKLKSNVPLTGNTVTDAGFTLKTKGIKGGTFTIQKITLAMTVGINPGVARNVYVKDEDGVTLDTIEVLPNTLTTVNKTYMTDKTIRITWDPTVNNDLPLNNKIKCGGCGEHKGLERYYEFTETTNGLAYGMVLNTYITCDNLTAFLCADMDLFLTDGWYRTVAKTYQAYVIRAVIGSILSSSQINRYTLLEKEFLYGKRNHLTKMISDRLEWLANNIPREYNTCWTCRTRGNIMRASILV